MDYYFQQKPIAFQVMAKPIGPVCNLNCKYCYYLEKKQLYKSRQNFKMPDNVLEAYVKQQIASQQVPVVQFVWQGGEPTLLGVDFYRKALKLQEKYANGKKIENIFQTNATLIDEEWCELFKEHDFLIGVSIDGPRELHDHYRVYQNGKPSWERIMKSIELLKKYDVRFNTLTVVNDYNSQYPLEIYRFLKRIGSGYMQFIPIVEQIAEQPGNDALELVSPDFQGEAKVSSWSVDPKAYGRFLISMFDEWVRQDVGKYYVQIFDVSLANWFGAPPGLCIFTETCGDAAVMEHNGDVYSCDHFVYPHDYLGNILDKPLVGMLTSEKQIKFGAKKRDKLPNQCLACEFKFACNGGCPKNRIIQTPQGEAGLNYLCAAYKMFFAHIKPAMDFMAEELRNERAPANVMEWVKKQEPKKSIKERLASGSKKKKYVRKPATSKKNPSKATYRQESIGKDDPCPCGSGKPFKNCCRRKPKTQRGF